jgi:hypothetical protein
MHTRRVTTLCFAALGLAGCGPSSTSGTGAGGSGPSVCATDPRAEVYAVGLTQAAMDGAMKVSFVDATPAPPAKGVNAWTFKLTDGQGAPISGAAITVKQVMPDHGHGSSITPQVAPKGSDGTYEVTLLEFFMPGIWEITFTVTPAGGTADTVVFTFCVDG